MTVSPPPQFLFRANMPPQYFCLSRSYESLRAPWFFQRYWNLAKFLPFVEVTKKIDQFMIVAEITQHRDIKMERQRAVVVFKTDKKRLRNITRLDTLRRLSLTTLLNVLWKRNLRWSCNMGIVGARDTNLLSTTFEMWPLWLTWSATQSLVLCVCHIIGNTLKSLFRI